MATITGTSAIKNNSQLTCTYSLTVTQGTQSVADNKTTINYSYYVLFDTNGVYFSGTSRPNAGTIKVVINGATVVSKVVPLTNGIQDGTYIIAKTSGSVSVPHNSDGTKTLSYSISMVTGTDQNNYNYVWNASSKSSSMTLTSIPRGSTIDSITGTPELGEVLTVNIARAVSSYTHKVEYSFAGGDWGAIEDSSGGTNGHGTTVQFGIPVDRATIIPNSATGDVTVRVTTYSGTTQIGDPVTKSLTLKVPSTCVPTVNSLTLTRVDNGVPSSWGVYVKGYSKVKATVSASGIYGSTISSYLINGPYLNSRSSSDTSEVLATAGTKNYSATVTDSRGKVSEAKNKSITVQDYYLPSVSVTAVRCDADGNESANGTSLKFTVDYTFASVAGKNSITSKSVTCNGNTKTSFSSGVPDILAANCSVGSSYTLTASITDGLSNTATVTITIPTASRVMNVKKNKKAIAFGTFATEDETVTMAWKTKIQNDLDVTGDVSGENITAESITASGDISGTNITAESLTSDGPIYLDGVGSNVAGCTTPIIFRDSSDNVKCVLTPGPTGIWAGSEVGEASVGFNVGNNSVRAGSADLTSYCGEVNVPWTHGYIDTVHSEAVKATNFYATGYSYLGKIALVTDSDYDRAWVGFYDSNDYALALNGNQRKGWFGFDTNSVNFYFANNKGGYIGGNKAWTNTSDKRLKTDIEDLPDVYVDVWQELQPKMFKWGDLNSPDGKYHFGLIAQDVMESFDKRGLDYKDFGIIGEFKIEGDTETEYYAITYEYYNMMTAAVVKKQQKEIDELKLLVQQLLDKEG